MSEITLKHNNYLQRQNGIVAGVCGGIAARYGLPTFLVRLIFLLTFIPGGVPGALLYIFLWILMPKA